MIKKLPDMSAVPLVTTAITMMTQVSTPWPQCKIVQIGALKTVVVQFSSGQNRQVIAMC